MWNDFSNAFKPNPNYSQKQQTPPAENSYPKLYTRIRKTITKHSVYTPTYLSRARDFPSTRARARALLSCAISLWMQRRRCARWMGRGAPPLIGNLYLRNSSRSRTRVHYYTHSPERPQNSREIPLFLSIQRRRNTNSKGRGTGT